MKEDNKINDEEGEKSKRHLGSLLLYTEGTLGVLAEGMPGQELLGEVGHGQVHQQQAPVGEVLAATLAVLGKCRVGQV